MEANVKPTTTTRGMLAEQTVLSNGQANTITYNTEAEQINQPTPENDPIQALWKGQPLANQLGVVEQEKPEVEEESETLGDEKLKSE